MAFYGLQEHTNKPYLVEQIMRVTSWFGVLVVGGAAGFFGSFLATVTRVDASFPNVTKAQKFELVNAAGITVATWEATSGNEAHLRFLTRRSGGGLDIGVLSDGRPIVRMAGRDGKSRIVMELDDADKPMLGMSDERWEGRVHLGFVEPDAPSREWDNWALSFRGFGSEHSIAAIGMTKSANDEPEGVLTVSGKPIR